MFAQPHRDRRSQTIPYAPSISLTSLPVRTQTCMGGSGNSLETVGRTSGTPIAVSRLPMRSRTTSAIGLIVIFLTVESGAAQQAPPVVTGLEALFTGDAQNAITLLKTHIFSADDPDPWAFYGLGVLYRDGKGVGEDRVLACAYFVSSAALFAQQNGESSAYSQMASRARDLTCGSLSPDGLTEMNQLLTCPHDGPPATLVPLASQQWVTVERTQWKVSYEGEEKTYPVVLPGCRSVVLPVAPAELETSGGPPGNPHERRFLQYFVWVPGRMDGKSAKELFWIVEEVRANSMSRAVTEGIYVVDDSSFEAAENINLEQLAQLVVTPSGDVGWTIATDPPRSGLIPIPVESAGPPSNGTSKLNQNPNQDR